MTDRIGVREALEAWDPAESGPVETRTRDRDTALDDETALDEDTVEKMRVEILLAARNEPESSGGSWTPTTARALALAASVLVGVVLGWWWLGRGPEDRARGATAELRLRSAAVAEDVRRPGALRPPDRQESSEAPAPRDPARVALDEGTVRIAETALSPNSPTSTKVPSVAASVVEPARVSVSPASTSVAAPRTRRLALEARGGTRIYWTLDPDFPATW